MVDKIKKVMGEFGRGTLHSGSKHGPKVTSHKQAAAIALSEARELKHKVRNPKGSALARKMHKIAKLES